MKNPDWVPDWFDIKNYDSVGGMDLLGWARALQYREFLLSKYAREFYKTNENLVERLAYVSKNPDCGETCWLDQFDDASDDDVINGKPIPVRYDLLDDKSVDSLTVGMAAAIWVDITSNGEGAKFKRDLEVGRNLKDPKLKERLTKLENSSIEEFHLTSLPKEAGESDQEYYSRYIQYMGGFTFAQVDIGAPDELLIEDFKKWLTDIRKLTGISTHPQKFTPTEIADWHKKRVLPFIDLTIWGKLMKQNITQHQVGMVLFPDDYDISLSDRVRRTIKPLADNLMKPRTVGAICMQTGLPHY